MERTDIAISDTDSYVHYTADNLIEIEHSNMSSSHLKYIFCMNGQFESAVNGGYSNGGTWLLLDNMVFNRVESAVIKADYYLYTNVSKSLFQTTALKVQYTNENLITSFIKFEKNTFEQYSDHFAEEYLFYIENIQENPVVFILDDNIFDYATINVTTDL